MNPDVTLALILAFALAFCGGGIVNEIKKAEIKRLKRLLHGVPHKPTQLENGATLLPYAGRSRKLYDRREWN
jgi:hypothetical protein